MSFSKYQQSEYRISIYGRAKGEWDGLADWVVDHVLYSPHNRCICTYMHAHVYLYTYTCVPLNMHLNRWVIQIPRLYALYRSSRMLRTFGEMLDLIFQPLFEVSIDPSSHPKLHLLLQQVVGFDCVDDESK